MWQECLKSYIVFVNFFHLNTKQVRYIFQFINRRSARKRHFVASLVQKFANIKTPTNRPTQRTRFSTTAEHIYGPIKTSASINHYHTFSNRQVEYALRQTQQKQRRNRKRHRDMQRIPINVFIKSDSNKRVHVQPISICICDEYKIHQHDKYAGS